jgi:hypothetical protein
MPTNYKYNKTWRQKNPEKRHQGKKRYYDKTAFAENHMKSWSKHELKVLINRTGTDTALAKKLGRSVRAIQAKRHRIMNRFVKDVLED